MKQVIKTCLCTLLVLPFVLALLPPGSAGAGYTAQALPAVDVWYGQTQRFGHIGNPQPWVNIVGNASDPDGIDSLVYSLNGGPQIPLSVGPDGRRLAQDGDFNVDIHTSDLAPGNNQVVIRARDTLGNQTVKNVTVQYQAGNVWPLPYVVDWSNVTNIQDVAQVVDGKWAIEGDSVGTVEAGYDRLIAIGDMLWDDYEVTVPITLNSMYGDYGVGFLFRWNGHTDDPVVCGQPKCGWLPLGAIGWIREGRVEFYNTGVSQSLTVTPGSTYWLKMRVETNASGALYSLKVWQAGQNEPSGWNITNQEGPSNPSGGSFMLIAHKTDANFGDVIAAPLGGATASLTVTTVGSGTVVVNPNQPEYPLGTPVTLTANANLGWSFAGWSGDLSGTSNPATIIMDEDKNVTATFTRNQYTLTVNVVGSGSVSRNPLRSTYYYGDRVTLTATANPGWSFAGWSGDLSGTSNPATITMNGNKTVTATFTQNAYTLTVNVVGAGTVSVDPLQATYQYGDRVTLTANPDPGWGFASWSGDLSGTGNPATVTMDRNKNITANFTQGGYELAVNVVGDGSVNIDPVQASYAYGDQVILAASSEPGWSFVGWSGDLSGTDNPATITMDRDKTVTATFAVDSERIFLPHIVVRR